MLKLKSMGTECVRACPRGVEGCKYADKNGGPRHWTLGMCRLQMLADPPRGIALAVGTGTGTAAGPIGALHTHNVATFVFLE
jgi:hypothetical protein